MNNLLDFVPGVTPGGGFSGQSLFYYDCMDQNVPENSLHLAGAHAGRRAGASRFDEQHQRGVWRGTSKFHGNAYEYFRNPALNAND